MNMLPHSTILDKMITNKSPQGVKKPYATPLISNGWPLRPFIGYILAPNVSEVIKVRKAGQYRCDLTVG